jgi:hypothetical protein
MNNVIQRGETKKRRVVGLSHQGLVIFAVRVTVVNNRRQYESKVCDKGI